MQSPYFPIGVPIVLKLIFGLSIQVMEFVVLVGVVVVAFLQARNELVTTKRINVFFMLFLIC
jgi:hypothetical protein